MRTIHAKLQCGHQPPDTIPVEIEDEYEGELAEHPAVKEAMEDLLWNHADVWAEEEA